MSTEHSVNFGQAAHREAYERARAFWETYDGNVRPGIATLLLESELVVSDLSPDIARSISCIALSDMRHLNNPEIIFEEK